MFCEIKINYKGKNTKVKAMIDTGNLLKDPITSIPVIVVEKTDLRDIIPINILDAIDKVIDGMDINLMEEIGEDYISRFRLIPFSSLGKQNGMLIGFKPDGVSISFDGVEIEAGDVIIGIYNKEISRNGNYSSLVGLDLLERRGN